MAARNAYEEAIRLLLETSGTADAEQLRRAIDAIGNTSEASQEDVDRLTAAFDDMASTADTVGKVDAFVKLKQQLSETEDQLKQAQAGAQALFREFDQGDKGNAGINRLQRTARKAVNDLSDSVQRQRTELQQLRGELGRAGIDTRNLGTAQGTLRARMTEARGQLAATAKSIKDYRADSASAAKDIPAQNERIAESYRGIGGAVARLRSIAGPVLAFLSLRSAVDGIKNLAGVASQAENARRALGNLYGSQAEGNAVYAKLAELAKRNGLAMDATVASAQKLKAFGLDPLNGSLQALIDQNAAVGGSQQDLEGKILALGQAWAKQKLQGEEILQLVERGVPVWDLLQKATGKNVQELQKLSEQGKLGRDTIAALIAEIGRASSGAATGGLSSLSGLVAQASARWLDFKQKVVEAGVGDYLKQQLRELLAATGGMDGLAKRVSDAIIGVLETAKRLGQSLAPIVGMLGNLTLEISRHATALTLLAKAYAAVKLASFFQTLAAGLVRMQASTVATTALGEAFVATGGKAGQLGGALGGLTGRMSGFAASLKGGALVAAIGFVIGAFDRLIDAVEQYQDTLSKQDLFQAGQASLLQEQLRLGQQLQDLYRTSADVAVQSGDRVRAMTRAQAQDYQFALEQARQYYGGVIREARATGDAQAEATATARWKDLGVALGDVAARMAALRAEADTTGSRFTAASRTVVAAFDEMRAKGESVSTSLKDVFAKIDFGTPEGIKAALDTMTQIGARGEEAAAKVKLELREALAGVANEDLPKVKAAAEEAFGSGSAAAKAMAEEVDRINLARLGVDVDAIRTGFTAAGRAAVDQFAAAGAEVKKLGLDAAQQSTAMTQAFQGALKNAANSVELKALKQALMDAFAAGTLSAPDFQRAMDSVNAKLAEVAAAGRDIGQGIAEGAARGASALGDLGQAAGDAASHTQQLGGAATESGDAFGYASSQGIKFALTNREISQSALDAYLSMNKIYGGHGIVAIAADKFAEGVNSVTHEINRQGEALDAEIRRLQEANSEFDELADRRKELAQTYNYLGAGDVEKLLQAEQELERNRAAAAQKEQQRQQEQLRATQAQADAAGQGTAADRAGSQPVQSTAKRYVYEIRDGDKSVALESSEDVSVQLDDMLRQLSRSRSVAVRRRS